MKTWDEIQTKVQDASGIDNPKHYLWEKKKRVYYPVHKISLGMDALYAILRRIYTVPEPDNRMNSLKKQMRKDLNLDPEKMLPSEIIKKFLVWNDTLEHYETWERIHRDVKNMESFAETYEKRERNYLKKELINE